MEVKECAYGLFIPGTLSVISLKSTHCAQSSIHHTGKPIMNLTVARPNNWPTITSSSRKPSFVATPPRAAISAFSRPSCPTAVCCGLLSGRPAYEHDVHRLVLFRCRRHEVRSAIQSTHDALQTTQFCFALSCLHKFAQPKLLETSGDPLARDRGFLAAPALFAKRHFGF